MLCFLASQHGQRLAAGGEAAPDGAVAGQFRKARVEGLNDKRSAVADVSQRLEELGKGHQTCAGNSAVILVDMDIAQGLLSTGHDCAGEALFLPDHVEAVQMDLYVAGPHVLAEANRVLGDVQEEGFKAVDALDANGDSAGILGIS